ncbi:MAG: tyrosine-protein phosphatase [Actinomycetes bacterium]
MDHQPTGAPSERWESAIDPRFRAVLGRSGIFNARDLGGLAAESGMVRHGLLVRADALHRARTDAAQGLADRGLSLVLDLRDAAERDTTAVFAHPEVVTEHRPVLDEAWSWEDEDHDHLPTLLEQRYRSILTQFGGRLAASVQRVADHHGGTAFHCAVGKDRTGLLAALLLGALGVPDELVVADYARSACATAVQTTWLRYLGRPEGDVPPDELALGLWSARPVTMAHTLEFLHDEFGGPVGYLAEHGAGPDTVTHLRRRLVVAT